jgi:microcystin-dependent protein
VSEPFIGEIRMFGGNFAPAGWAFCDGSLLPISENDALFNLIGTTYGGDGQSTFALPDLRGRIPIHMGQGSGLSNRILGQQGGVETVTLTTGQIPSHTHALNASSSAATNAATPADIMANPGTTFLYAAAPSIGMHASAVGTAGGSQPHTNLAPYLCVSFIISLFGIFPSQ